MFFVHSYNTTKAEPAPSGGNFCPHEGNFYLHEGNFFPSEEKSTHDSFALPVTRLRHVRRHAFYSTQAEHAPSGGYLQVKKIMGKERTIFAIFLFVFAPCLENETRMIEKETDISFSCTNNLFSCTSCSFSCTDYPFKSKNLKNNIIHGVLTKLKTAS
jgi:hypothetical protein